MRATRLTWLSAAAFTWIPRTSRRGLAQRRRQDRAAIDDQQRASINALASDFPRLWQDPKTPDRGRKRMVRLLLDQTLMRGSGITVHVRFNGGATKTLELPSP